MTKIIDEHLSGEGTQANPYVIHDSTGLGYLSGANLEDYGVDKYYELGADIDMSGVANFEPIGTNNIAFIGHFDGKNHTISNFTSYATDSTQVSSGLFYVVIGADIKNIIFDNCVIGVGSDVTYSNTGYVGVIPWVRYNNGITLENIVVKNSYFNSYTNTYVSCLIGASGNKVSISNCYVDNCVILNSRYGGFILGSGSTEGADGITNCTVTNSYISTTSSRIGGIIGSVSSSSTITNCNVLHSTIEGATYVGGIYGYKQSSDTVTVTGCTVSDCSIIGTSYVSGVGN